MIVWRTAYRIYPGVVIQLSEVTIIIV